MTSNVQAQSLVNEAGKLMMSNTERDERRNTLRKSVELLEKAIQLNDTLAVASQSLISCYIQLGERSKAIGVSTRWLKKFPNDANALLQRGMLS